MDGVRSAEHKNNVVTITKMVDNDIVFYDIPNAKLDNVFLSDLPFHHVDEDTWNRYF